MSFVGALFVSRAHCKYSYFNLSLLPWIAGHISGPQQTYATAPHAKARRVKRMPYCIFVLVIF